MPIRIRVHTGDADQWITVHPNGGQGAGTHILIGANGEIKAGAGGKFNGKQVSAMGSKPAASKPEPTKPAEAPKVEAGNATAPPKATAGKPQSSKLSANEKSALSSYSGDDFLRINKELREGKGADDPTVQRIDSAIEKSSVPAGTTLYRGMSKEAAKQLFPGGSIDKGMVISDPSFASTSKSSGTANTFGFGGVMLKIETGNNAKGLDMAPHSRNTSEQEVLLPRNAKMRVLGVIPPKALGHPVIVRVAYGD